MTTQEAPAVWKCRYRLATGCTTEAPPDKKQTMYAHEKVTAAHALHRITLSACPECGRDYGGELGRATHLAAEHGVTAGSERRQELDARQVKELFGALYASQAPSLLPWQGDGANGAGPAEIRWTTSPPPQVPDGTANLFKDPDANLVTVPSPNGDSPAAFDLGAAQDMFAALLHEVVRLRAIVADLEPDAAMARQIKSVLGQG